MAVCFVSRSHLDTFALNPQYIVTLEPEADQEEEETLCTMIVSLMQLRSRRIKDEDELLSIGNYYQCNTNIKFLTEYEYIHYL